MVVDEIVIVVVAGPEVILGAVISSWAFWVVKVDVAEMALLLYWSDDEAWK